MTDHTKFGAKIPTAKLPRPAQVRTTKAQSQPTRPSAIGQQSILACTNWAPATAVSTIICERTGLTCTWQDDLGAAYMASYAIHPRFLPGAWQDLQRSLADRSLAAQLDPRLIAAAVLYLLTAPRANRTPILHHYSTLELSVINSGLAQLGTGTCLRLYKLAQLADWSEIALSIASLSETHGIPIEQYATEIVKLILRQAPDAQDRIAERHTTKSLERKELAQVDQRNTIIRKVDAASEARAIQLMHIWLQPWRVQADHWTAQLGAIPQENKALIKRDNVATQAAELYKRLGVTSLVREGAYVRLSETALSALVDQLQALADQCSDVAGWISQDQQVKYLRCLAVLRKELTRKASLDDTCLD